MLELVTSAYGRKWRNNVFQLLAERALTKVQKKTLKEIQSNSYLYNQNLNGYKRRTLESLENIKLVSFDGISWRLTIYGGYIVRLLS
jgi:hypothetical protein